MESGLGTVVLIDVSAKHVDASDVYLRNIELLVLRLLTYHQHSAGHSKWGFSFFESECAGRPSRREPGRKPQHEISSQSFHTFSKNLRNNTRGKTAERYLSVRDVDGSAEAGSVTTSASATPSALSAAGGTHGHAYSAQQEPAPRQPLSKGASTLSRAQRITHALKDALGDYEWEPPPSSRMPRNRGAGQEGSASGLKANNVLLVFSPCPRDGAPLEDFIRPSSSLDADEEGSSARHSSMRDKEQSSLLDITMQRVSLCDAYKRKGIILGWIDTACVLSRILHSSGPHDLGVGGSPSLHMRRFIESFGGRIMGMQHLLYGSSALPFALRYETALNLPPLDVQSTAKVPPAQHMGCLAGLNLPRDRGAHVSEPREWTLAANLQIRPMTTEMTKKCEKVASKTESDVAQTSVQVLCMVKRADVTPLWFEMDHVYWCQDVTRTLSGNVNDSGTFSKMLVDLMDKGLVLRVRVTQGECSFEAILFPLTSCLAGLQVLKHTGHDVCESPSRASATPARSRRKPGKHSPGDMELEEAEALLRKDLQGRQAGASARCLGGGSAVDAGRGRFVLKMITAMACPLDAEDAWDSMMIAAEDEDVLTSSGNGTGEGTRSSREASASASAELPHLCDLATDEFVPHHLEEWSWLPIKTKILHVGAELERGYNPETSLIRSEMNKRMMQKYRHYREKQRRRTVTEGGASTASDHKHQEPVLHGASHHTDPKANGTKEVPNDSDHNGVNNVTNHVSAPLGTQIKVPQTHPAPSQESDHVEGSDRFASKERELAMLSQAYTNLIESASSQDTAAYLRDIINNAVNALEGLGLDAAEARKAVSTHLNNNVIQNPKGLPGVIQSAAKKDAKIKSVYEVQALIRLESELLRGPTCADPLPQKRIQPVLQLMGKLWLQMTDLERTSFLETQMWPYYSAHLPKTLIQIAEAYDLTLPHSLAADAAAEQPTAEDKADHEALASPITAEPERQRVSPRRLMPRGSVASSEAQPAAAAPKQSLSEAAKRVSSMGGSASGAGGGLERRSSGAGGAGAAMFRKLTMRHAVGSKVPKSLTISKKESKKLKRSISGLKAKKETNEGVSMSSSLVRRRTTSGGPQPPTKPSHTAPLAAGQSAYTSAPEMKTPQRRKLASTTILVPETPLTKPAAKVTGDRTGDDSMPPPPPFDLSAAAASAGSSRLLTIGHVATSAFTGGEVNSSAVGAVLGQKNGFGDVPSQLGRGDVKKGKGACDDFVRGVKEALGKLGRPQRAPSGNSPVRKSLVRGGISPLNEQKFSSSKGKAPKEEAMNVCGEMGDGVGVSQNMSRLFDEVSVDKSKCSDTGLGEAHVETATAAHTNIAADSETLSGRGKGKMTEPAEFGPVCVQKLEETLPLRSCEDAEEVGDAAQVHADATGTESSTRKRGRPKGSNKDAASAPMEEGSSKKAGSLKDNRQTPPRVQHVTEQRTLRSAQKGEVCHTDKGNKQEEVVAAGIEEAQQDPSGSAKKRRKVTDAGPGGVIGDHYTNPSDDWELWEVATDIQSGGKRKAMGIDADGDALSDKSAVQTEKRKSARSCVPPQRLRPALSNKVYPVPK